MYPPVSALRDTLHISLSALTPCVTAKVVVCQQHMGRSRQSMDLTLVTMQTALHVVRNVGEW